MNHQPVTPDDSCCHLYYSNYHASPSHTGEPAGPLWFSQTREYLGVVPAGAVDASTSSGHATIPGPGSPYFLGGFPSEPFPDESAQRYVGPGRRGYALHSLPRGSASSPWSCMTPRPANVHPAIPRHYLSTPNMNPVPIALMQGPTSVFIVTQANYDCSQPFPIIALSQPCTYQEYSLSSAMAKDFDGLFRPDEVAFQNVTFNQKVSIRLRIAGCPQYNHQASLPRTGRVGSSPTRAAMATLVAREIKRFIDLERDNGRTLMHPAGRPLILDDLCLLVIKHVSRASIQPIIGLWANF